MNYPKRVLHLVNGLVKPENIHCICRNYAKHAAELGNKVNETPMFFEKSNTAVFCGSEIEMPPKDGIQHELEIVILIGKSGVDIPIEEALEYVSGITLGIDFTDRNLQSELKAKGLPWFLSKSFKNSAWIGNFDDPEWDQWNENFWLKVNGELKQSGNMSDMIFNIAHQISYLSSILPLAENDIIFTGTPEGVGPVKKGDLLELGVGKELQYDLKII